MFSMKAQDVAWSTLAPPEELPASVAFLPLPAGEELTEAERKAMDYVIDRDRRKFESIDALREMYDFKVTPLFTALLQSPRLAELWANFGDFFMTAAGRDSFSDRERELADQAIVPVLNITWTQGHIISAVACGIKPTDIVAIQEERLGDLDPADRELVEYVQAAARGKLDRPMFECLVARMGRKAAVEYTGYAAYKCGLHLTVAAMNQIQGVVPDRTAADNLLNAYLAGMNDERLEMKDGWVATEQAGGE